MKKCYCCGADVPDQSKFCPKCGKPMEITQDLIDRAKAGGSDAQTELYERTYKTVYSRIRAKVPDEDTVMDIMQESYLSAFTNLDQLQKAEAFPSWLLTIANRQVGAWYRKNGKENENIQMSQLEYENDDTVSDEDDLLDQPEYREDFSPDESLDCAETGRLLSEILDTLPEDQRIILTMRYYDEMSLKEISEEMGVNLNTVKTRLTAGKKKVEAKVLELEKSGTKLYSLGPVAFLVFLLHHMELFTPAISANTVIGLTAAGAGTAAGGTAVSAASQAAAGVTGKAAAGAAVKAAGGAAVKGLGVRIAAVAAAIVIVGGVVTALILSNNDQFQAESTGSEQADAGKDEPSSTDTVTPDKNVDKKLQKSVTQIQFSVSADGDTVMEYHYVFEFDRDGNQISQTNYREDGTIQARFERTFDSEGNELTLTAINYDTDVDDEIQSYHFEYAYDNNGNILTEYQYQYNDEDDSLWYIFVRTYDGNGNILNYCERRPSGHILESWSASYDNNGNMITYEGPANFSEDECCTEYTYDKNGNRLKSEGYTFEGDEITSRYTALYDYNEKLATFTQYHTEDDSYLIMKATYTYDDDLNCIKEESENYVTGVKKIRTYEYEYYD